MKPIKIQNDDGEDIEIKFNDDGIIEVRHSDIDPEVWGELMEYSKVVRIPGFKAFMAEKGLKDMESPDFKEVVEKMGGYLVMPNGQFMIINRQEVNAIYEAVKQAGGIIPNWASRRV
jgi:hypothetical protein